MAPVGLAGAGRLPLPYRPAPLAWRLGVPARPWPRGWEAHGLGDAGDAPARWRVAASRGGGGS
eukprot:4103116-Pleurochrysis_carterae.AAC.1